jgi:hypothetical protein
MGGMFQQQQTPAQTVSGIPPELQPFLRQYAPAVAALFNQPAGVTPLEEGTVRGIFQGAGPAQNVLAQTVGGAFLPGTPGGQENPFLQQLFAGMNRQDETSQRQLASAAQRSGALNSTDYLRQSADLAAQGGERRSGLLAQLYDQERQRQLGGIGQQTGLGQALLNFAGYAPNTLQQRQAFPFQTGGNLLAGGRGQVIPGQTSPSPFASLLSGLAPFIGLFG